jgi:DNA modification methylase
MIELLHGDCLERLRELADNSVDACVTDPPYGLSFMGKAWDYDVPTVDVWREVLRVLKPGGHLLAFAGTRTQHRMAVAIEDAGFEIRDMIAWVYGSGFPKSMDVSKAIDKQRDDSAEALEVAKYLMQHANGMGLSEFRQYLNASIIGQSHSGGSAQGWTTTRCGGVVKPQVPTWDQWQQLKELLKLGDQMDMEVWRLNGRKGQPGEAFEQRKVIGQKTAGMGSGQTFGMLQAEGRNAEAAKTVDITAPATPAAQQWQGWGTALKPALEPITVARRPLTGTVATNVLKHSTGAINVDGCRVGDRTGRWPANLIHDGSDEPCALLGDAARFFYCAKASKADRGEGNSHPTVKPTELMRYLCRLVTPPGGVVLDPFMGSGSTGKAAVLEGFKFIGIEREAEYLEIARGRIEVPAQGSLL